jgi:hypothetical protein
MEDEMRKYTAEDYATAIADYEMAYRTANGVARFNALKVYRIEGTGYVRVSQGDGIIASRHTLAGLRTMTEQLATP